MFDLFCVVLSLIVGRLLMLMMFVVVVIVGIGVWLLLQWLLLSLSSMLLFVDWLIIVNFVAIVANFDVVVVGVGWLVGK